MNRRKLRMWSKSWRGIVVVAAAYAVPCGATVAPDTSTPVVRSLRALAGEHPRPVDLATEIEKCSLYSDSRYPGCKRRLQEVLEAFAATGGVERSVVTSAIDLALSTSVGKSAWADDLRGLARRINLEGARPAEAKSQLDERRRYIGDAHGKGPPSQADVGRLTLPEFNARLLTYVDSLLPSENREVRVNEALKAGASQSCESLYHGVSRDVCRDLGLAKLRLASLRLAMIELKGSRGSSHDVDMFLDVDRSVLLDAVANAELSNDDGLIMFAVLIRRWLAVRPNRWQAWADIEELLGPT
jgi:hypothetical protein